MKKIISVFVVLVIAIQICCLYASADEYNENLNLLLLGDSIAAGTGLVAPEECCYGALIAKANNYNYENKAYSGRTARMLTWDLEYDEDIGYSEYSTVYKVMNADII